MSEILSFSIKLPSDYRREDFFAFHQRDQLMIAEHVQDQLLTKGIIWHSNAILLKIKLKETHADAEINLDNSGEHDQIDFQKLIERMLGLQQDIVEFEKTFSAHPQLGSLIAKNSGLRVIASATPFEAISWAIIGQQISVNAAISIRRKFIQLAGIQHSSGLWCYPDEYIVSSLNEESLRQAGFSQAKANSLITVAKHLAGNQIDLHNLQMDKDSIESISNQLMQIRGIGPWSINYALLRGLGWLDGSLHGDVAVRRSLQKLLNASAHISEKETQRWLLEFSPWRALVAAHLWEMHKAQ